MMREAAPQRGAAYLYISRYSNCSEEMSCEEDKKKDPTGTNGPGRVFFRSLTKERRERSKNTIIYDSVFASE